MQTYHNRVPIRQPELLRPPRRVLLLLRRVRSDVTALLLDRADDLAFGGGVQVVARFSEEELEVVRDVSGKKGERVGLELAWAVRLFSLTGDGGAR
jgi:hypothetical protein